MKIKPSHRKLVVVALLPVLTLIFGCPGNAPTEPSNQVPPPPGTGNPSNASFNITVSVTPPELEIGEGSTSNIRIVARRADNGLVPPNGTTIVVSTTLGDLGGLGQSIVASLLGGVTNVTFNPGDIPGTATITAQLQASLARATIRVFDRGTFFLSSVSPAVGSPEGGDEVRVLGGGFAPPVRVDFGGRNAQVLSMAPNSIRVLTPNFPTGAPVQVNVGVTINVNEPDEMSDTLSSAFTYTPGGDNPNAPAVFGILPTNGPNEGGTQVTIPGPRSQQPLQVLFDWGTGGI